MNNRIRELRTSILKKSDGKKYTQKDFAEILGVSENYIWQIEKGDRSPSGYLLRDISEKFNVNQVWLETGVGDPLMATDKQTELKAVFADVLSGRQSDKNAFIEAVAQLPDDIFPVLIKSWIAAAEEMKQKLKKEE